MNATDQCGMRLWINEDAYFLATVGLSQRDADKEVEQAMELAVCGRMADLPIWAALSSDEGA